MPVFHTKTIEFILDPVAQQVSRLVIIHEEGEAGHEMPDLTRPVDGVSRAVNNLVKVGREMVTSTDDDVLRQDMPSALTKVESAAKLLEEAAKMSQIDPYSKNARTKLIEGSRWILQGTSNVLMVFDESEVRKIILDCKRVLDYLAVAEVIETLEDLVQFVRDLSPCLAKVTKEVERRIEDLTHQIHREILGRSVEQIKTLAPILICSMKIFIQILSQGGKGVEEAAENRNYLSSRMSEEVGEMIRVLQLTTYDEDEWDSDNLTVMRKTQAVIEGKMQTAQDWLKDPTALLGGVGEKAVRNILSLAFKVADRSLPLDSDHLKKLSGDIQSMTEALCELRQNGDGTSPLAETLARNIESRLDELLATVNSAVSRVEKSGIQQPSPTVAGRLEQARRWLEQPAVDDRGLGRQAIFLVVDEGYKIADVLPELQRGQVLGLCQAIEQDTQELTHLCREGQGESVRAMQLAKNIATNLGKLQHAIQTALVDKVVEDFLDVASPLKLLTDCVVQPPPAGHDRDRIFEEKSENLSLFSDKTVRTAKMVAVGTSTGNKKIAEALLATSGQVESLTPQLINAGRIRMVYPDNKSADEHFENLRKQYAENLQRLRGLCDVATDSNAFVAQSYKAMEKHAGQCEDAIRVVQPIKLVENTSSLARLANRVLQVAKQEAENSEDPAFIDQLSRASQQLHAAVTPMVQSAKSVATNMTHPGIIQQWRQNNIHLLDSVQGVQEAISASPSDQPPLPPYPDISDLAISDQKKREVEEKGGGSQCSPKMTSTVMPHYPTYNQQIFSDEELSEIFQIDFAEIFGSPDKPSNKYGPKKTVLPSKAAVNSNFQSHKPPKAGSLSPLPPPTQFASREEQQRHAAASQSVTVASFSKSSTTATSQQFNASSQFIASRGGVGGVRVLPALNQPVQLQEPRVESPPRVKKVSADATSNQMSIDSNEADRFIEQLMHEAQTDPKLRALTYGTEKNAALKTQQQQQQQLLQQQQQNIHQQQKQQQKQQQQQQQQHPKLNDIYPMIARPYRTQQDMIIRDKEDDKSPTRGGSRPAERHRMPKRPYRTNEDLRIVETAEERSKSADGRLSGLEAFKRRDPKLEKFRRTPSTGNVTEEILNGVVTDNEHHGVKDLVAMIEKNTKSESANAYVRKWGCDLISPEPHSKNLTYRMERKEMPDERWMKKMTKVKTHMWANDDLFRSRNKIDDNLEQEDQVQDQQRDDEEETDFPMSAHITDLDDLLGRDKRPVLWPPPHSPQPPEDYNRPDAAEFRDYDRPEAAFSPSPPPPPVMSPSPVPPPPPPQVLFAQNVEQKVQRQQQFQQQQQSQQQKHLHFQQKEQQHTQQYQEQQKHLQYQQQEQRFQQQQQEQRVQQTQQQEHRALRTQQQEHRFQQQQQHNGHRRSSNASLSEIDQQIITIQNEFEAELDTMIDAYRSMQQAKKKGPSVTIQSAPVRSSNLAATSDDEGSYQALSVVFQDKRKDDGAPPRPPLPSSGLDGMYGSRTGSAGSSMVGGHGQGRFQHPPDTTDDESEDVFLNAPTPSQGPIMMAAHDLHQEVKQWSSKDNDIIAAAKKMALLMAKLSQLVGEDAGSKRDLISCAKAIAEASNEVTRIAKELARECTDKRMRTTLLQVCERIPTIATQLKILSTVKATMLGAQGTEEDQEATEMLVGNAQNLMQSVKQTVTAAEAASIKIRTDAGIKLKWIRKQPWYQY